MATRRAVCLLRSRRRTFLCYKCSAPVKMQRASISTFQQHWSFTPPSCDKMIHCRYVDIILFIIWCGAWGTSNKYWGSGLLCVTLFILHWGTSPSLPKIWLEVSSGRFCSTHFYGKPRGVQPLSGSNFPVHPSSPLCNGIVLGNSRNESEMRGIIFSHFGSVECLTICKIEERRPVPQVHNTKGTEFLECPMYTLMSPYIFPLSSIKEVWTSEKE